MLAELHVFGLKPLAHGVRVGRGKGDVVETPGVLEFLLGAADDNALARLARAHQMHGGDAAQGNRAAGDRHSRVPKHRSKNPWCVRDPQVRSCSAVVHRAAWLFSFDQCVPLRLSLQAVAASSLSISSIDWPRVSMPRK